MSLPRFFTLIISTVFFLLTGCSNGFRPMTDYQYASKTFSEQSPCATQDCLITANYKAADKLVNALSKRDIPKESAILLVSFVNLDRLEQTTSFGRLVPAQISSRMSQQGYTTIELKSRHNLVMLRDGQGEFSMTRKLPAVNKITNGQAVLTGTYRLGTGLIHVNARIVSTRDQRVLAGADYTLPLNMETLNLMTSDVAATPPEQLVPSVATTLSPPAQSSPANGFTDVYRVR